MSPHRRDHARSTRLQSTDPRSVASQRRLVEALKRLVKAEGIGAVSVTRVAQEAGLSRSGFYEHFGSVDDLTLFVLDDLLTEIGNLDRRARVMPGADTRAISMFALELVLDAILDNRQLFEHILSPEVSGGFIGRTIERFGAEIQPEVRMVRPDWPESRLALIAASIGGALVGGIVHHLRSGECRTAHELAAELMMTVPDWLYEGSVQGPGDPASRTNVDQSHQSNDPRDVRGQA
ncbi:TetR/AcrR family transcriptional regulator [Amycolatopsis thermoflava]|uniref:TetR/AcrR family transcriptional regulator n=1 Tax=Amycolatopsis thermoflava TaxID=84480 RepID=UPI0038026635